MTIITIVLVVIDIEIVFVFVVSSSLLLFELKMTDIHLWKSIKKRATEVVVNKMTFERNHPLRSQSPLDVKLS